jgi:hypothetical protein
MEASKKQVNQLLVVIGTYAISSRQCLNTSQTGLSEGLRISRITIFLKVGKDPMKVACYPNS